MTSWDITGLIHNIDLEQLKESITETSTTDLVFMYRSLVGLVDVCLKSANIPSLKPLPLIWFSCTVRLWVWLMYA